MRIGCFLDPSREKFYDAEHALKTVTVARRSRRVTDASCLVGVEHKRWHSGRTLRCLVGNLCGGDYRKTNHSGRLQELVSIHKDHRWRFLQTDGRGD